MTTPAPAELAEADLSGIAGGVRYAVDNRGGHLQSVEPDGASTRSIARPDL